MWRKYPKNKKIYYFHIVLHFIYCGYFRVVNLLLFVYDTVEEGMENGKKLSMQDVEELSWRYAREIEHSDDNLNALEDWLFGMYAPEGCMLEDE